MKLTYENERWVANVDYGQLNISRKEKTGYRPYELFVSAVAGCLGEMLIHVLRKKRIPYQELIIHSNTTREGAANQITHIHLLIIMKNIDVSDEQMKQVVQLAMKHCSMVQSLKGSIDITTSLERL
ncbi:OsmC family protein [Bacillus sp. Bos-x628]|uniref:OsmC family protein n=1 Tax=Bacillus maqinnsis TaxID=3229854 RepID=UPI00338D783C